MLGWGQRSGKAVEPMDVGPHARCVVVMRQLKSEAGLSFGIGRKQDDDVVVRVFVDDFERFVQGNGRMQKEQQKRNHEF